MILFLDIETAPEFDHFKDMPEEARYWFRKRFKSQFDEAILEAKYNVGRTTPLPGIEEMTKLVDAAIADAEEQVYLANVSFLAESARVVCVSVASMTTKDHKLTVKSIIEANEEKILNTLLKYMDFMVKDNESSHNAMPKFNFLCAHNGMEFDFPFLMRRFLKFGIQLPRLLDNYGKKPWEMPLLDTVLIWKGSSYKFYAQLAMIAYCLGIPSPKGEMDGSMVAEYFRTGRWKEIAEYCNGDVIALVNVFQKMMGQKLFDAGDLIIK